MQFEGLAFRQRTRTNRRENGRLIDAAHDEVERAAVGGHDAGTVVAVVGYPNRDAAGTDVRCTRRPGQDRRAVNDARRERGARGQTAYVGGRKRQWILIEIVCR